MFVDKFVDKIFQSIYENVYVTIKKITIEIDNNCNVCRIVEINIRKIEYFIFFDDLTTTKRLSSSLSFYFSKFENFDEFDDFCFFWIFYVCCIRIICSIIVVIWINILIMIVFIIVKSTKSLLLFMFETKSIELL